MSHEIRTPMNGVLGVLHLLQRENLSEEGFELLQEASNCGRMLSQLLDDVIDFSRIEAGRLDLSPEPIDAAQVLDSVVGLLRPNAAAKGLELRASTSGLCSWIMADPMRLRQALFNLIGNAVKFTAEGHVEASLTMREDGDRRRLRFEIEDTGIGIPDAVQASLFHRFQQADGSTSRRFGGSGLGLAITRRLAELMDGDVGFTSKEGVGTTFWLEICADATEPVEAVEETPTEGLDGLRILLVEDNPTNRLVATKILETMGVVVNTAEHGGEGVEAARTGAFDLILMDVQMPIMDGLEATRCIRALGGKAALTPIVGLTANAMAHQWTQYRAAGMDGMAAKPISPAALLAEIARVLSEPPA
jgi:CheY-like chemotaxis protein